MAKKAYKTVTGYRADIVRKMKALNVYKPEFRHGIDSLAQMLFDYYKMLSTFEESGGHIVVKHTNKSGATNAATNPFYRAIEVLRKDILVYSRELGLTPAGLKRINETSLVPEKRSSLADALRKISNSA